MSASCASCSSDWCAALVEFGSMSRMPLIRLPAPSPHYDGEKGLAEPSRSSSGKRVPGVATGSLRPACGEKVAGRPDEGRKQADYSAAASFLSRAAFSLAKSSPAWWDERVSGLEETIRKPLV
ncbi:hypothetical protein ACVMB3_003531 [Sinorhizobium meliloti]|nr:hypothetical protein SAMN04244576_04872 [Sinorhizobium meliloti]